MPSAEEAMADHSWFVGALVSVQATPEFVEVYMPPSLATAASLLPSAEEAMEYHARLVGAVLFDQVTPELVEV
jgi:hypothetical protein